MPVKVEKSVPLLISFRSHHNAYKEGDGSGTKIIKYNEPNTFWHKLFQVTFGLIFIHYFLWFIPMLFMVWLPYQWGYPLISVILLGIYLPTYFNKDELKYGRPWDWFKEHWCWNYLQFYGQLEVVREAELDPERKYIFGTHPHGILILSRIANYGGVFEKLFPGIEQRCLGATPMFNHPGSRELCLWMGAVRADKSNAVRILSTDKLNLLLYPGGSDEIFLTNPCSKETTLVARKGFIRLALQQGCDLVPSFVFGEKHAYHKLDIPEIIKSFFMKKLRTPLIIFWGRFFTWLPLKQDNIFLSVVFGSPIKVEKVIPEPSDEEVDALYEQFYGDIRNLFNKYKKVYGYDDDETLVIQETKAKNVNRQKLTNGHQNGHSNGSSSITNGKNNGSVDSTHNGFNH